MKKIFLASTNQHKLEEYQRMLVPIVVENVRIHLEELQGTGEENVRHKARQAFHEIRKPVMVDDTGLFITAWNELPGVYIRHFLDNIGNEGVYRMLKDFTDKRATAKCWIGYCEKEGEIHVFEGAMEGEIVEPRGMHNFGLKGWDAIFLPHGSERTFGELTPEEKALDSHRKRALDKLKKFLDNHP